MKETIRAVDLFAGAGGISWGLVLAVEELDTDVELAAVNHWERTIETHKRNHPWADHYHAQVEELTPSEVFEPPIDILTAGPECTHWSSARGGKPVDEQKRTSPWYTLDWVEKLRPENSLLENVPEIKSWGPVDEDGRPTRNGELFEAWVNNLHALGYSVDWDVLNAANYGDATSRKRLFVIGRKSNRPEWPEQTHSENGEVDGTKPWCPAADIIDWSNPSESSWSRSRPLVNNTMRRIAEGIRRHGRDELEPFADAITELGKDDVELVAGKLPDDMVEYEWTDADRYDHPYRLKIVYNFEAISHYDLSWDLDGLYDEVRFPSTRFLEAGIATGEDDAVSPEDVDDRPAIEVFTFEELDADLPIGEKNRLIRNDIVTRVDQYEYRVDPAAYREAQRVLDDAKTLPCGHTGFHNLDGKEFECGFEFCNERFDLETVAEVFG